MAEPVIFAVDDDSQVLAAIRRDLRSRYRADYRVLAANSGEAALDAIKELKARGDALAMLISDQRMPSMSGLQLLEMVQACSPGTVRVLLTGQSDLTGILKRRSLEAVEHLIRKPWEPEGLREVVRKMLEKPPRVAQS